MEYKDFRQSAELYAEILSGVDSVTECTISELLSVIDLCSTATEDFDFHIFYL